jgi:hypothetical protein
VHGAPATEPLRAERARHIDVGIEQRVTSTVRWQATLFRRDERDILRLPDTQPRLVNGALLEPDPYPANVLTGSAHGLELLVERRAVGLSGWLAYSYGKTRYADTARGERFWGDFDQRHALTISGVQPLGSSASVSGTFRMGSNFPVPGYFASGEEGLIVGSARNRVRLPPYARLDLRADRELSYFGRRLTLYAELLNALNRRNAGLGAGVVDPMTGRATGFIDALFPRRVGAGIVVDF